VVVVVIVVVVVVVMVMMVVSRLPLFYTEVSFKALVDQALNIHKIFIYLFIFLMEKLIHTRAEL
jgi:hypothetical protein